MKAKFLFYKQLTSKGGDKDFDCFFLNHYCIYIILIKPEIKDCLLGAT